MEKNNSKNAYPFASKTEVKARLASDSAYATWAIGELYKRQTEFERSTRETKDRNKVGFMSSHAWHGSRIGAEVLEGKTFEEFEVEDRDRIMSYAKAYSKQVARFERERTLKERPELAATAAMFGIRAEEDEG